MIRVPDIRVEPAPGLGLILPRERPPRIGLREILDNRLIVGRDRPPVAVLHDAAVLIEHDGTYREQLKHLSCEVFIRDLAAHRIDLRAPLHVEVLAHNGMQRDAFEQVAEVAECVVGEEVQVRRWAAIRILHGVVFERDDQNLGQCKSGAQA